MSGFAWLNELMTWLSRWVPRLTLIKATHHGVLFGPGGSVVMKKPGLAIYWPMTHDLQLVSTRSRTMELACMIHGSEAIQVIVGWRIIDVVTALMSMNDPAANMDDRAQSALAAAHGESRKSEEIAERMLASLGAEMASKGVHIESVDVSQRGPVFTLKNLNDWAVHEARTL